MVLKLTCDKLPQLRLKKTAGASGAHQPCNGAATRRALWPNNVNVFLSSNVNKGLEAKAITTKLKFLQYQEFPQTPLPADRVQMINSQVSLQKKIRRCIYHANSKVPRDAGVGGSHVTGSCYNKRRANKRLYQVLH